MKLNELIDDFQAEAKCEPIALDEDGFYRIDVDGHVLAMTEDDGMITFFGEVGPLPETGREAFYRKMLAEMFPGGEAGWATLSIKAEDDVVALHRQVPAEGLLLGPFCAYLRAFAETQAKWRGLLEDFVRTGGDTAASAPQGGQTDGLDQTLRV